MTKLENWCTICSFPLITMCQIIFLNTDYFLIYANYGVDHKTVSSSSMWLARGRRGTIEEYFFVWVTQRWMVYCLRGLKRQKQLNSAISWRKCTFKQILNCWQLSVPSLLNILLFVTNHMLTEYVFLSSAVSAARDMILCIWHWENVLSKSTVWEFYFPLTHALYKSCTVRSPLWNTAHKILPHLQD